MSKVLKIAIGVVAIILVCILISMFTQSQQTAGTPSAGGTTKQPATPLPIAPSFAAIADKMHASTQVQWDEYYNTSVKNHRAEGWKGTVNNVNKDGSGYKVQVSMPDSMLDHCYLLVGADVGPNLNKDQAITFSGDIESASSILSGLQVTLKNVEIK